MPYRDLPKHLRNPHLIEFCVGRDLVCCFTWDNGRPSHLGTRTWCEIMRIIKRDTDTDNPEACLHLEITVSGHAVLVEHRVMQHGGDDDSQEDYKQSEARLWEPPSGYVGAKTICSHERFRKNGKNPPRTTVHAWIKRSRDTDEPVDVVKSPDSHEVHIPEDWVADHIRTWNPRAD